VVDNAFATPALQRPMEFGADVTAYSATKMMDGQGRVLAGAVCGTRDFIDNTLLPFTRNTGPTLSPFNAWVVLKGLETLDLRIRRQSENALKVGAFLEGRVARILHPGLPSHPQHELLQRQLNEGFGCGGVLTLDMGSVARANRLMEILQNDHSFGFMAVSLGYFETLMSCSGSSTSSELTEDEQAAAGISPGLIRISIGLTGSFEQRWAQMADALDKVDATTGI
jgi:O-succinylhomoserine sulfhydrylase